MRVDRNQCFARSHSGGHILVYPIIYAVCATLTTFRIAMRALADNAQEQANFALRRLTGNMPPPRVA
jgi:hypothetical protein